MITPEFELLCYALVIAAIFYTRHNPFKSPAFQAVEPVAPIVEATPVVKPVTPAYKRPANKGFSSASCRISVDTIAAPILPQGWNLDKHGNPLKGAALNARKRKLGIE